MPTELNETPLSVLGTVADRGLVLLRVLRRMTPSYDPLHEFSTSEIADAAGGMSRFDARKALLWLVYENAAIYGVRYSRHQPLRWRLSDAALRVAGFDLDAARIREAPALSR